MRFKSHVGRDFDFTSRSNLALLAKLIIVGGVSLILWLSGQDLAVFLAPAHAFVVWALMREIDPDHEWTALLAGAFAGGWSLLGGETISAFAIGALMVAARLVAHTTGRRPLNTDLLGLSALAAVVAFSVEGWLAGFGIGVAIYLDDRFRAKSRPLQLAGAALSATAATIVAAFLDSYPTSIPRFAAWMIVAASLAALILIIRDPAEPRSRVDAHHDVLVDQERLHSARSMTGLLVVLIAIFSGEAAVGLTPVLVAVALAILVNEFEMARRRRV